MSVANEVVYIKADKNVEVKKRDVTLGDVLSLECGNMDIANKLKTIRLLKISENKTKRIVVSILRIIELIHEEYPGLTISNMGEPDIVIIYENKKKQNSIIYFIKVFVITVITFVGAAFSIMSFNNDVSTAKLFSQIYELLVGRPSDGFTILELSYSVGLAVGILVFFNHFGRKKFSVDPTPMEVEMRLYENDIQTALIQNYSRKEQEIDVGQTKPTGSYRT